MDTSTKPVVVGGGAVHDAKEVVVGLVEPVRDPTAMHVLERERVDPEVVRQRPVPLACGEEPNATPCG